MDNGVIDASFTNFRKAVAALHASNLLHWTKEPTKVPEKPQAKDFDHTTEIALRDAKKMIDLRKRADDEACINNAIYIVKNHASFPHSRTDKERSALKAEFEKQQQLFAAGKTDGAGLLAGIRKLKESF